MKRNAECCCGDLKVEVSGEPEQYGMCHCNNCKKRTGSAFGLSAYFKNESITGFSGEPSCYELQNPSDGWVQKRYFCKRCGTTLYWQVSGLPALTGIAGGCFSDTPLQTPGYSTSHSGKLSWIKVPCDMKRHM